MSDLITDLSGTSWIQLLGATLAHFLWQGAAVALLLAISLRMVRNPSVRYLLGCGAMFVIGLCPMVTIAVLRSNPDAVLPPVSQSARNIVIAPTIADAPPSAAVDVKDAVSAHPAMILLVAAWLVGVATLAARNVIGWRRLRDLRQQSTAVADQSWLVALRRLQNVIGIDRLIELASSARFDSPATFGALRPIIIIPASMLSGLPAAQIEAILAHELAHIRRHDYLVNLFQTAVETVLFYHPAVWWIGAVIRREREYCCDDIAARACGGNLREYARALLTLQLSRDPLSMLAPAAAGGSVVDRARRLLSSANPPRRGAMVGTMLAVVIAITVVAVGLVTTSRADERAEPATQPAVTIEKTQTYYIGGVKRAGVYQIPLGRDVRVSFAIKLAGGVDGDGGEVQIVRKELDANGNPIIKRADVEALRVDPNGPADLVLRPDDKVIVIPRFKLTFSNNPTTAPSDRTFLDFDVDWKRDYRIGLFDVLRLSFDAETKVRGFPTTREVRVQPDGNVLLGDLKIEVRVDGDTVDEAIHRITRKLIEKKIIAKLDIQIVESRGNFVNVMGQVEHAGQHSIAPGTKLRLSEALRSAEMLKEAETISIYAPRKEGENSWGDPIRILKAEYFSNDTPPADDPVLEVGQTIVVRTGETLKVIPTTAPARDGGATLELMPEGRIHILGQVQRPGEFAVKRNLRLSQAILAAGGMTTGARSIQVYSANPPAGKLLATFDAEEFRKKGPALDPVLEPGQAIVVNGD